MKTAPAPPVSRPERGDARAAILDAALQLVRQQGWAATSVEQLCRAAGVSKGAFFHHFPSKEALGVAAAERWSTLTGQFFDQADYHRRADPLARLYGYLELRAALATGPLEAFTCFAGTTVQEAFATSEPVRAACGASIVDHASRLVADLQSAIDAHPPAVPVTAESLALFTQTVLQGGFVLAKAKADATPVLEAVEHLKRYFEMLFRSSASASPEPAPRAARPLRRKRA